MGFLMAPSDRAGWRGHFLILAAAMAYGLLVYAILPGWPIAMNDDFAYLRSVIETVRHGRPWTDDFLEPWSLSLTALSAVIFKASGSMVWATVGLQTVLAAVSFWLICRIACDRGCASFAAVGIAACLLTFPTLLWKQVEYTAVVLYLPCLFAALLFSARGGWLGFFLVWAIAVASRQSAVTWLAIPLIAGAESAARERNLAKIRAPALMAALGAGWFLFLSHYANPTHARRFTAGQFMVSVRSHTFWANLMIGLWVLAVSIGGLRCYSGLCGTGLRTGRQESLAGFSPLPWG